MYNWIIEFTNPESNSGYECWYPLKAKDKLDAVSEFQNTHGTGYVIGNILNMSEEEYLKFKGWK